jgi:hypothetical protein
MEGMMNLQKLKQAEKLFLENYPGGFENPEMAEIRKKHNVDKMIAFAQNSFSKENFRHPDLIAENMIKVITRSSVISVFEKPRFRDFVRALPLKDKQKLASGLEELLHGREQPGFETVLEVLKSGRLAKWSLITNCPTYFRPQVDIFIKPTTVKGVIEYFELKDLHYKPTPAWAFYEAYRSAFNEMKSRVSPVLAPTNAAFSGFLMMSMAER